MRGLRNSASWVVQKAQASAEAFAGFVILSNCFLFRVQFKNSNQERNGSESRNDGGSDLGGRHTVDSNRFLPAS